MTPPPAASRACTSSGWTPTALPSRPGTASTSSTPTSPKRLAPIR